ncbi:MAG TPA: ZIP family metal transporter [Gemmatimonadaceae bacterium]|nr:ZIP family metal transporter [Gemmatimonadaceae bacterium]
MTPILYASVAAAGNLLGALVLTTRSTWSRRTLEFVLAFSAGFLVAVSLAELVPEAVARGGVGTGGWILGGFVLVHLTQHALVGHFHFGEETHEVSRGVGVSALVGLMLHTFVDGVAIATSFAVDARLGAIVLAAIVLHKLPEGLAIGSLFVASGRSVGAAVGAAAALGVATIVGAALAGSVELLTVHGLALSGGVTLYVGASNLIPEFQAKKGWSHNMWFFAGVAVYAVTELLVR